MMLSIILTNHKLFATAEHNGNVKLLPIGDGQHIAYEQSMQRTLIAQLDGILDAYRSHAKSQNVDLPSVIPATIVFPVDTVSHRRNERDEVLEYIEGRSEIRVIHDDNFASAYVHGKGKGNETWNDDYILLEALDGHANLFYHYGDDKNRSPHYVPVKELGYDAGYSKVRDYLVGSFAKEGLVVGPQGEEQLLEQIKSDSRTDSYQVTKESGDVSIEARVKLPFERYEDLVSEKRTSLKEYISGKTLDGSDYRGVIVLGDYFDNSQLKNFMQGELGLGDRLDLAGVAPASEVIKTVAVGANRKGELVLEAERKEAARIAKLQAQRQKMVAREQLMQEIRSTAVDPDKVDEYKARFEPRGAEVGIPAEVIAWNIDEALAAVAIDEELKAAGKANFSEDRASQVSNTPTVRPASDSSRPGRAASPVVKGSAPSLKKQRPTPVAKAPTPQPKAAPKPEPKKPTSTTVKKEAPKPKPASKPKPAPKKVVSVNKSADKPAPKAKAKPKQEGSITDIMRVQEQVEGAEFALYVGKLSGTSNTSYVRVISNEELKDSKKYDAFRMLNRKENAYYDNVSQIFSDSFGKYYTRDYVEAELFVDYVTKNGLNKKKKLNDIKAADLRLINSLLEEVRNLKYGYDNINFRTVQVVTKGSFLNRSQEIRLEGFTSPEYPKGKMMDDLMAMLEKVFTTGVYKDLKQMIGG